MKAIYTTKNEVLGLKAEVFPAKNGFNVKCSDTDAREVVGIKHVAEETAAIEYADRFAGTER